MGKRKKSLSLYIYTIDDEEGKIKRCIFFGTEGNEVTVNILYHEGRYYYIRNFARFMSGTKPDRRRVYYCKHCLSCYKKESTQVEHQLDCAFHCNFSANRFCDPTIERLYNLQLPDRNSKFYNKTECSANEYIEKKLKRYFSHRKKKAMVESNSSNGNEQQAVSEKGGDALLNRSGMVIQAEMQIDEPRKLHRNE